MLLLIQFIFMILSSSNLITDGDVANKTTNSNLFSLNNLRDLHSFTSKYDTSYYLDTLVVSSSNI